MCIHGLENQFFSMGRDSCVPQRERALFPFQLEFTTPRERERVRERVCCGELKIHLELEER